MKGVEMSSRRFRIEVVIGLALTATGCGSLGYRSVDKATFERAKRGESALDDRAEVLQEQAEELKRSADEGVNAAGRSLEADETDAMKVSAARIQTESARLSDAANLLREGENLAQLGLYYTVEPLVALDSDLDATAIPALGVNWRPWEETALALQGIFGGAINPSGGGDDVGAALGFGFSHPVSENGALSFGHVWWSESGDGDNGWYIGINLGNFTIPADDGAN